MNATLLGILLVIVSSAIEGLAQVCLKQFAIASTGRLRWMILGISLFIVEALLYTGALQRLDISTAYLLGALSFVSVTFFSRWILHEVVDRRRWIGLILIVCGAGFVAAQP
jgi:drug/metabolite transporter (DMT)-like permease